jgi:hypothetical protein
MELATSFHIYKVNGHCSFCTVEIVLTFRNLCSHGGVFCCIPQVLSDSFLMALPAHLGPWPHIQFRNNFVTDGRTSWTSDQPVARPLPKHRTTQTQKKRIHTPNIHALIGIRTHDPSVRASESSSCVRPRGYCERQYYLIRSRNRVLIIENE